LSPNQEISSSEQSSDEDDKENKSVRTESIQQQGTSQNVERSEVMQVCCKEVCDFPRLPGKNEKILWINKYRGKKSIRKHVLVHSS